MIEFTLDSLIEEPRRPEDDFKPSEHQVAIFDSTRDPAQDLIIQAVAGSGKTTTILKAIDYAPGSSLFMAFNKAIAEDIRLRAPPMAEVKTLNALGHRLVCDHLPGANLNARKMSEIVKRVMGETSEEKEHGYSLARVCGIAKNTGFGIGEDPAPEDFSALMDAFGFDIPADRLEDFGFICREAFELSRLDTQSFDFDDQLWIPVKNQWLFPQFDNCFVDECQDLSPIQHLMLERIKDEGARIIGVGDRHQAIYGFRGASHASMDILKGKFEMHELPLSTSYRCAQSVVLAAQEFCPEIRWREGAPEGELNYSRSDPQEFPEGVMILCRNNAPLFRQILWCVRNKKPCQVLSSFLDTFQSFVRSFKTKHTLELRAKLERWYEREKEAAQRLGKKGKLIALEDKYQTTKQLAEEFKTVQEMIDLVKSLGYSKRGPIFATIHKAKGLECERVYILSPNLLDGYFATTPEQKQQEDNLHYVAITRAKLSLTYGASR